MNEQHFSILKQGTSAWNGWRSANPDVQPDLSHVGSTGASLPGIDFSNTNLTECDLTGANLVGANLSGAQLQNSNFFRANLKGSDLRKAQFSLAHMFNANFTGANAEAAEFDGALLWYADFTNALCGGCIFRDAGVRGTRFQGTNLTGANFEGASFIKTHLDNAIIDRCRIYGASVWDVQGTPASQNGLVISSDSESSITVDELQIGQFIHLLLNNRELRNIINTVARKGVLIIGRFTSERKAVLDAIRLELRKDDYVPLMFDFDKPDDRSYTETLTTLAHLSRFVIADVTDAKVVIQELQAVMPALPSVPVKMVAQRGADLNLILGDFAARNNLLPKVFRYEDQDDAAQQVVEQIIKPAEAWIENAKTSWWKE